MPSGGNKIKLYRKYPPPKRGRLVVWGFLASAPYGGMTWQVLHYLVGFRRLGFDVWYVSDSDTLVFNPTIGSRTLDYAENVEFVSRWMEFLGLEDRWIFRPPGIYDTCLGCCDMDGLMKLYKEADAVFNVCGAQELKPYHENIKSLVYLQTDPVFDQIAIAKGDLKKIEEFDAYSHLFTYGVNLGSTECPVPIKRYNWKPTRPPVYPDWWIAKTPPDSKAPLTTVMNWKTKGKDTYWNGQTWHWEKNHAFQPFINLPYKSKLPLELAVGRMDEHDMTLLRSKGWRIVPVDGLVNPSSYRKYILRSLGEFTAVKELYVLSRSGWFSDRSVCYLASGRPVVTQETGFGNFIPTGEGLFSFTTEDEALAAIETVASDYEHQSNSAREIAQEYFDAELVLKDVLHQVGLM